VLIDRTIPSSTFVMAGTPTTIASSLSRVFRCFLSRRRTSMPMRRQIAPGVVFWPASKTCALSNSVPLRSVSRNERKLASISTASMHPRSALKLIISGGRPPLDSPSPTGLTRSAASRSSTTLVTVGALRPEARTRSAFEHDPTSRKSFRIVSALACRRWEGLPTEMDLLFK